MSYHSELLMENAGLGTASAICRDMKAELARLQALDEAPSTPFWARALPPQYLKDNDVVDYDLWLSRRELGREVHREKYEAWRRAQEVETQTKAAEIIDGSNRVMDVLLCLEDREWGNLMDEHHTRVNIIEGQAEQLRRNDARKKALEEDMTHEAVMLEQEIHRRTVEQKMVLARLRREEEDNRRAQEALQLELALSQQKDTVRAQLAKEYDFFREFLEDERKLASSQD
eukprot:PhM_4_TR17841/c0_g1_i1/m.64989